MGGSRIGGSRRMPQAAFGEQFGVDAARAVIIAAELEGEGKTIEAQRPPSAGVGAVEERTMASV